MFEFGTVVYTNDMTEAHQMTKTDETPAGLTRTLEGRVLPLAGSYTIDASHTSVGFVARHLMVSKVRGSFPEVSGTLQVAEDPTASSLEVTVGTASVTTREDQRDAHLRSADFFEVEKYPEMRFAASSARAHGENWVVEGELTIKETTRPVSLEVEFLGAITDPWGGSRIGFSASTEINREDFGLGWNMALEAGGVVVGKTVRIEIEAELVRQG
jgi:polyisoprenoid-binding protein YceI